MRSRRRETMSKSFSDKMRSKAAENPALMFISQAEEPQAAPETKRTTRKTTRKAEDSPLQAAPETRAAATSGARPTPPRKEYKSRRLQLLIQPSLYEEIKNRAEAEGLSVNEEIHNLLRQALGE
jgi:hypothetical protein